MEIENVDTDTPQTSGRRRPQKARRGPRREWTKTELRQLTADLKARRRSGESLEKIAKKYKRTPSALRQKMFSLGISAHGKASR